MNDYSSTFDAAQPHRQPVSGMNSKKNKTAAARLWSFYSAGSRRQRVIRAATSAVIAAGAVYLAMPSNQPQMAAAEPETIETLSVLNVAPSASLGNATTATSGDVDPIAAEQADIRAQLEALRREVSPKPEPTPESSDEPSLAEAAPTTQPGEVGEPMEIVNPYILADGDDEVEEQGVDAFGAADVTVMPEPTSLDETVDATMETASTKPALTDEEIDDAAAMLTEMLTKQTESPAADAADIEIAEPTTAPTEAETLADAEPVVTEVVDVSVEETGATITDATDSDADLPAGEVRILADRYEDNTLRMTVNDTRVIHTDVPYFRVSVASPEVADVKPIGPKQLLVTAHATGSTQLVLWDENDEAQTLLLQAGSDLRIVSEKLSELLPNEKIEVVDLRGSIALRGSVSSQNAATQAEEIASAYGQVLNLLEITGNQLVQLHIQFAEVSRNASKELGFNAAFTDGPTIIGSNVGNVNPTSFAEDNNQIFLGIPTAVTQATQFFGRASFDGTPFYYFINALRENNLLRVLAEPSQVVLSGETGDFLAGGEFPVPVPQDAGVVGIEYREFGIKANVQPVVLGDGRIRLKVDTEYSQIDRSVAVSTGGVQVPGLRKRTNSTTVDIAEGQTLAIAGLLNNETVATKQSVPILGDLPIIGAGFRGTKYSRQETELVVLITPVLVSGMNPDEVPPLPGENWKYPNEFQLLLQGQLGGEAASNLPHDADRGGRDNHAAGAPRLQADYAFTPVEEATGN